MRRAAVEPDSGQSQWAVIRATTDDLSFDSYSTFIEDLICVNGNRDAFRQLADRRSMPFPDTDLYRVLKVATELFMQLKCGVFVSSDGLDQKRFDNAFLSEEELRVYRRITAGDINDAWREYVALTSSVDDPRGRGIIPYLRRVLKNLTGVDLAGGADLPGTGPSWDRLCDTLIHDRLTFPCFIELIWSYWHEEGMLVQTMKALSLRFQNRRYQSGRDPLGMLEIDPLRPLNNLLWGYIQDEQHRLTVARRAYEYDHHYGITLLGEAVPPVRGADTRSRFLEAYHNLLQLCTVFYKEDDDTTVVADGFPILNALRETHLLLAEGAHNQYRDLPWTARQEMLIEQWLLSRPQFREFLPRRVMVDYPEPWMHSVEAMKTLQGWTDSSILHFRDLARFGERLLLSIRFGNWTTQILPQAAANWARYFRPEVQGYVHAYRAVTGVDLTEFVDATLPALLLQQRLPARTGIPQLTGRVAQSLSARPRGRALPSAVGQPGAAALPQRSRSL
jgi:hypothetical protein